MAESAGVVSIAAAGHITRLADSTSREKRILKRRIRIIAVTGITIMATALVTLSTTAASAATTTTSASGHVNAPRAAEATGCVADTFGIWDENTYERCVRDEQVLLNDLYSIHRPGPNQLLTVDGFYGHDTTSDVTAFQSTWGLKVDGITGIQTWGQLCQQDEDWGFRGAYFQDAGCPAIISP